MVSWVKELVVGGVEGKGEVYLCRQRSCRSCLGRRNLGSGFCVSELDSCGVYISGGL